MFKIIKRLVEKISELQYIPICSDHYHISSAEVTLNRGNGSCIDIAIAAAFLAEPFGYPPDIFNIHAREHFCSYRGKQIPRGHSVFYFYDGFRFRTVNLPENGTEVIRTFRNWRKMVDAYRDLLKERGFEADKDSWSIFNLNEVFPDIDWRRTDKNLADYLFDDDVQKK